MEPHLELVLEASSYSGGGLLAQRGEISNMFHLNLQTFNAVNKQIHFIRTNKGKTRTLFFKC